MTPRLFQPITLRGLSVRNRIWLAPMCQYSVFARDGIPTDWHLVHYGARATGGFGLLVVEATAVAPEGRISAEDLGLWNDAQAAAWPRIVDFAHAQGAAIGVQLAHAGRKAECGLPSVAPSAVPAEGMSTPRAVDPAEIPGLVAAFAAAAQRAVAAGFDAVEIHGAHGYLIHEFLSPLSNHRTDAYGGSFDNRVRLLLEVTEAVRAAVPDAMPVLVRLSATDWVSGGWDVPQSVALAGLLAERGVDLIDVSSGGNVRAPIPVAAGYQVPLATAIRTQAQVPTGAVGLLTDPAQAEEVLANGSADVVLVGRVALREPSWPLRAAAALEVPWQEAGYPTQYLRGRWPLA